MSVKRVNHVALVIGGIVVMGILSRFFGDGKWDLDGVKAPWGTRSSIYEHIRNHIVDGEDGLSEGGDTLPDDAEVFGEGSLRWVSGGLDGAFGHHSGGGDEQAVAKETFRLLKSVLGNPTDRQIGELYDVLKSGNSIDFVDPLLELIVNGGNIDADRLHDLAIWLATRSADREPVKVALALLGIFQGYDDRETILTLARHEEFTLYAAVAITNQEEDPERTLWQIARNVDGWGRIQTVERLAGTTDPEIKGWLLREGYKNSVMYEYLAQTCAVAGDLHGALESDQVDEALLLGAGEIIQTLITGQDGPAGGIDDYEDGAAVTRLYLHHLSGRADSLDQFLVLKTIEGFLSEEDGDWAERSTRGWTQEARRWMQDTVEEIVAADKWRDLVHASLKSNDRVTFGTAAEAAGYLGIDTWDEYYSRATEGEDYWFQLMQTKDPSRIEKVVALAEERMPLSEIATGPSDDAGFGPGFMRHMALDFILQDLGRFPGLGWSLIKAGLRSPGVRNRSMSIRALSEWGEDNWPEGAREYIESCRDEEPNDEVRQRFIQLLSGEEA